MSSTCHTRCQTSRARAPAFGRGVLDFFSDLLIRRTPCNCAKAKRRAGLEALEDRRLLTVVQITQTDQYMFEASEEPGDFIFTRVTDDASQPLNVEFRVRGTATEGSDYQTLPRVVTIPAHESSVNLTVATLHDTEIEYIETVIIDLVDTEDYDIDPDRASDQLHIYSDDIDLRVRNASVVEGTGGTNLLELTMELNVPDDFTHFPVKVDWITVQGTALSGIDYLPGHGEEVTFESTDPRTKTIVVSIVTDSTDEPDEVFHIVLSNASAYHQEVFEYGVTPIDPISDVLIIDDDGAASAPPDDALDEGPPARRMTGCASAPAPPTRRTSTCWAAISSTSA